MSGGGDMERLMKEISRMLEEREFESEEEMQAFLTQHVMGRTVDEITADDRPRDPLDQAQEVMYDAWETPTKRERIRLAEAALEISPDCADAYALLAEEKARSAAEAGEGPAATAALREAVEQNPHVPEYLLGRKRVPARAPETIGWGT